VPLWFARTFWAAHGSRLASYLSTIIGDFNRSARSGPADLSIQALQKFLNSWPTTYLQHAPEMTLALGANLTFLTLRDIQLLSLGCACSLFLQRDLTLHNAILVLTLRNLFSSTFKVP
jgi:hypothetical protein